jgi:hypothetical protein
LKHQPQREMLYIFHVGGNHCFGEFFLNSSCNAGSFFGCFVSGWIFRQP